MLLADARGFARLLLAYSRGSVKLGIFGSDRANLRDRELL